MMTKQIIKKTAVGIIAVTLCAANTYNFIQNERANNSINNFISLSSGDYDPWTGNGGTRQAGQQQTYDLTCYKVKCLDLGRSGNDHNEWYNSPDAAAARTNDYNQQHSSDWPPKVAVNCSTEYVRISGVRCDNTCAQACISYNCSSFNY